MELLLLCASSSAPLLNPNSHFPLRRSFPAKLGYKGNALVTAPVAAARRSMVVMDVVRPEKEEHVLEVEKNEILEPEVERLTADELEKIEAAVMEGKDEGRAPLDYDRRARIFHESSRVFTDVNYKDD